MTHDLPVPTPEQTAFGDRLVAAMIPFLDDGMDMLHAERAAAPIAAAAMLDDGADPDKVAALLFQALNRTNSGQLFRHDDVLVSEKLYERLIASFKAAGGRRLPPVPGMLVEKRLIIAAGQPVYLYSNESKHPGRPHVTIVLGDERINVTIEAEPVVLVGNKRARGLKAAMASVGADHVALLQEWDASRPDDQRLENFKRRKKKAAREFKS